MAQTCRHILVSSCNPSSVLLHSYSYARHHDRDSVLGECSEASEFLRRGLTQQRQASQVLFVGTTCIIFNSFIGSISG